MFYTLDYSNNRLSYCVADTTTDTANGILLRSVYRYIESSRELTDFRQPELVVINCNNLLKRLLIWLYFNIVIFRTKIKVVFK